MSNAAKVRSEALALSEVERVRLCNELLESIHGEPDQQWIDAWGDELALRSATYDQQAAIPADQVLAKLRAILPK